MGRAASQLDVTAAALSASVINIEISADDPILVRDGVTVFDGVINNPVPPGPSPRPATASD